MKSALYSLLLYTNSFSVTLSNDDYRISGKLTQNLLENSDNLIWFSPNIHYYPRQGAYGFYHIARISFGAGYHWVRLPNSSWGVYGYYDRDIPINNYPGPGLKRNRHIYNIGVERVSSWRFGCNGYLAGYDSKELDNSPIHSRIEDKGGLDIKLTTPKISRFSLFGGFYYYRVKIMDYHGALCWENYKTEQILGLKGFVLGGQYSHGKNGILAIKYVYENSGFCYFVASYSICTTSCSYLWQPNERHMRPEMWESRFHVYTSNLRRAYPSRAYVVKSETLSK
jgi:hypothetical protein